MNDPTVELIELRAVAPSAKLTGLDQAIAKLNTLDAAIKSVQGRLAGLSTHSSFRLTASQFAAKIPSKGPQNVGALAKLMGFPDVKDVRAVAREVEGELQKQVEKLQRRMEKTAASASRGSTRSRDALRKQIRTLQASSLFVDPSAEVLRNPTRAGVFLEKYAQRLPAIQGQKFLQNLLKGGGGAVSGVANISGLALGPGKIKLVVPANRIEAVVKGGGGGGEAKGGGGSRGRVLNPPAGEIALEKITKFPGSKRQTVIQRKFITDVDETVDTYLKDMGKEFKRVTTRSPAKKRLAKFQAQLAGIQNDIRTFGTSSTVRQNPAAAATFFTKQAAQVGAMIPQGVQTELAGLGLQSWTQRAQALQATLQGRAATATAFGVQQQQQAQRRAAALAQQQARAAAKSIQVFHAVGAKARSGITATRAQTAAFTQQQSSGTLAQQTQVMAAQQQLQKFLASGGQIIAQHGPAGGAPTRVVATKTVGGMQQILTVSGGSATLRSQQPRGAQRDRLTGAIEGLSPRNMAANLLKVTEWAAAVGALYKTLELANYSLHRLEQTGMEMAHLSIIFRGVGGSVTDLTSDMIKLAAAQGRSTDETMQSATAWARLGGDRETINKEVEASARAANIADMHMSETTKQLQSLMHIYHLEADGLNGALGMLVNTSLKYNVTLEELFTGLDRSAAAARVARVPLSELQAMLGVVIGATGQTGAMTGNSLKYIFQELNKSGVQRQLRGFGVESLGNNLEQKPAGQILSELAGKWNTLGGRSQQQLSGLLGGRFNAARVPVILENYPQILKLAIDAQLNLNSAQEANVKILDTLKAQLTGVRAEWDKIVMSVGNSRMGSLGGMTPMESGVQGVRTFKNVLALGSRMAPSVAESAMNSFFAMVSHGNSLPLTELAGRPWMGLFNRWMEGPGIPGQEGYQSKLAGARQGIEVSGLRQREFGLGMSRLRTGSLTGEDANIMASVMQQMPGGQASASKFLTAFQRGNMGQAMDVLSGMQQQAAMESTSQTGNAASLTARHAAEMKLRHEQLTLSVTEAEKAGTAHEDLDKQLLLVDQEMQRAKEDADELGNAYSDLAGEIDVVRDAQEKYGALLKTHEAVMGQIEDFFHATPAQTPLQSLAQDAAAYEAQLQLLTRSQEEFDRAHATSRRPEDQGMDVWFNEQIKEVQAKLDAANSPARQQMAQQITEQGFGRDRAGVNAGAQRYGIDETVKLLNERRHLLDETTQLESQSNRTTEQYGRLQMDIVLQQQNLLSIRQRAADVEREIHQLAIDQNKEFTRQFFGAGPADMLRKLAAFRMTFDSGGHRKPDVGQGGFFSMGPEMRGDYGMLNPQYNPHMIELKREQAELQEFLKSLKMPDFGEAFDKLLLGIGQQFADVMKKFHTDMPTESMDAAKIAVDRLAGSSGHAAEQLDRLAEKAGRLADSIFGASVFHSGQAAVPSLPQGGGVGGGRGHSN